eukprot:TRINITY_DN10101_c0_g1_i1.p1 TRINITY_DN10101_c0_g1~~TRINITY_DN10101_c0_g1_i1.p1  ORF type:complete len:185 (-),score=47.94 TRINITY_DN10101_c0_g1_i1:186-740(-)
MEGKIVNNPLEGKDVPRDAKAIAGILSSMGVEEYEPRVVNMLMEFMHRYVSEILLDSQGYASHAGRSTIDLDDVRIATQAKVNFAFTQPPPREVLLELAQSKNSTPLPLIQDKQDKYGGVLLPPDEYCLTSPNYQMAPNRKKPKQDGKQEIDSHVSPMDVAPTTKASSGNKIHFNIPGFDNKDH